MTDFVNSTSSVIAGGETGYRFDPVFDLAGKTAGEDGDGPLEPGPYAEPGKLVYYGTNDDDAIDLSHLDGDVEVYGFAGSDVIVTGSGDDFLHGGLGLIDVLVGGAGNDTIVGGGGTNHLEGGEGSDQIHDGSDFDAILPGEDDDVIFLADDGTADVLIFEPGTGVDIIDGFVPGLDNLNLIAFGFEDFDEVNARISYNEDDQAMLDLGNGDALIFTGLDAPIGWDDVFV